VVLAIFFLEMYRRE